MASALKFSLRAVPKSVNQWSRCLSSAPILRNAAGSTSTETILDIRSKLKDGLKAAMKGRQKEVAGCIKAIMADITYHEKAGANPNEPASEESVIDVIRKGINQRTLATQSYPSDHPNHSALQAEIDLLNSFLPATLSQESITATLQKIIDGLSPDDLKSKAVTGTVLRQFWDVVKKGDVADKKSLGKLISELLGGSPTGSSSTKTSGAPKGTRQMSTLASSSRCMSTSSSPPSSSRSSSSLPNARLDYKKLTSDPAALYQNALRRNVRMPKDHFEKIGSLHEKVTALGRTYDERRGEQRKIGERLKRGSGGDQKRQLAEDARILKSEVQAIEEDLRNAEDSLLELALVLPNDTHPSCPIGPEENAAKIDGFGPRLRDADSRRDHQTIATKYDWVDNSATALVSGTSWPYLKGFLAMLELAVTNYAMGVAIRRGWTPVMTPDVVKEDVMTRCGFQPRDLAGQTYFVSTKHPSQSTKNETTQLCLSATAEIPLAGLSADQILPLSSLPIRYVGLGRAFRAEAGARGADTRGLYRVHQFSKVELFAVTDRSSSEGVMEEMRAVQTEIFSGLGLSVRLLDMPTEELGASAYRKYDMEAWMPGRGKWGEISSTSNCTDYQARRLNIRYRGTEGLEFAHTLNGTCAAVPRLLVALVENGIELRKGEGEERVTLPAVLRPYWIGGDQVGTAKDPLALHWA